MNSPRPPIDVDALIAGLRAELSPPAAVPSIDEVMLRVRHEVALRRGRGSPGHDDVVVDRHGRLPRWQAAAGRLATQDAYVLGDFLARDDADFIETAYRALLRRPPDEPGFRFHLAALREARLTKVEVLAALRWSPEGEARGVHVDGLLLPYLVHKWQRKPVIGPVLRWLHAFGRLPALLERQTREGLRHAREAHELGFHVNALSAQSEDKAARIEEGIEALSTRLQGAEAELRSRVDRSEAALSERVRKAQAVFSERLGRAEAELSRRADQADEARTRIEGELARAVAALSAQEARLSAARDALAAQEARLSSTQAALDGAGARLQGLESQGQSLGSLLQQVQGQSGDLSVRMAAVDAALGLLQAARTQDVQDEHALDELYARFEDRFRGSEGLVRERVAQYLDNVKALGPTAHVVDLGCGRGEWLQLMRENGLRATGVDTNRVFIAHCRDHGLDVVEADAIAWLQAQPATSVSGITSLHLVEHLPFDALMTLLSEAFRVIVPGGLLLLETPNPENLIVSTHGFYMDPTHRNPLPPEMLAWLVQSQGFEAVQVERLTLARELGAPPLLAEGAAGAESVNPLLQRLHAAPDYAVVARRP